MRILLIEDDELVAQALVNALSDQHYTIDVAADGLAGWELLEASSYDLILLDVILPKLDGITLCRRLRSHGQKTPILLLTAQDSSTKKVIALDAGADDYLTKPFDLEELLARMRALLRRGSSVLPPILKWGDLHLDPSSCEVTYNGQPLHLTPKEYGLLELFLRNNQRVFSRGEILDHLWSFEAFPGEETVTSHIKGLRRKLKEAGLTDDPIETVYGLGYRLRIEQPQQVSTTPPGDGSLVYGNLYSTLPAGESWAPNSVGYREGSGADNPPGAYAIAHSSAELLQEANKQRSIRELEQQTLAGITSVWQRAKEKFSSRVMVIEQATAAILKNDLSEELRQLAEQEAHKLAGSLGMFELAEGSRLARETEQLLQAKQPLNHQQRQSLSELVVALRQELEQVTVGQAINPPIDERPLLLIVTQDRLLAADIASEAANWEMRVVSVPSARLAGERLASDRPDVVLLDVGEGNGLLADELTLLSEISGCQPSVPVLILSAKNHWLDRVNVARWGGRGFLQKSMPPAQILEMVAQVLERMRPKAIRVLAVDDDPQLLKGLHNLLEPWRIKLFTLDNPSQFWETLEATAPDLLILDVEMQQISGIDLCQIVRSDQRWAGLPVLFLTAHTDAETKHRVFESGADDFVSKPVVETELLTRILNRLERVRLLRNLSEIDVLTGVANRCQSIKDLTQLLGFATRYCQPFCFAILAVDALVQINDQHGYASGDQVLSRLGELLRQGFQSEDVVARWGGAEFVIGMYGMLCEDGVRRLTELLRSLRQEVVIAPDGIQFQVSFSAGLVEYPQAGSNWQALYRSAKVLLLQAKARGGNCILSAGGDASKNWLLTS